MHSYYCHIKDQAEATAHLSFVEDAAYCRLMRKYYVTERPLPADKKAVQRLVGARTKEEREAVSSVLEEFFTLEDDGWHNAQCDEEIERYKEGDSERAQKNAHEKERMRRHREERARLFAELRELGITPKWDTPTAQLRAILERTSNAPATRTGEEQERTSNAPATANHIPLTINQEPETNNQKPIQIPVAGKTARGTRLPKDWTLPPDLEAWAKKERPDLDIQSTADSFRDYWVSAAGQKGVKADWAATWRNWVRSQRQGAARAITPSFAQQDAAERRRNWEEMTGTPWTGGKSPVIDVTPATLGIES